MLYKSTRDASLRVSFSEVLLKGLPSDGGLFIPEFIPRITDKQWSENFKNKNYRSISFEIFRFFISASEINDTQLKAIISKAYSEDKFHKPNIVDLVDLPAMQIQILELFNGPTFSFKDIALQIFAELFEYFNKSKNKLTILGATSGDTGSAALSAMHGKPNINCFILYPNLKISQTQEHQMTQYNLDIRNQCNALGIINSNFDYCQNIVKKAFLDCKDQNLCAINSTNFARIIGQIVYYAYISANRQEETQGLTFVVPTGNFGNALSGWYFTQMRPNVCNIVISTNENDILYRFMQTGNFEPSAVVHSTLSPSMDITISSNFERFLFHILELNEGETAAAYMTKTKLSSFASSYTVTPNILAEMNRNIKAYRVSDQEMMQAMYTLYVKEKYLACPHTAISIFVGLKIYQDSLKMSSAPKIVCLATAHIGKFINDRLLNEARVFGDSGFEKALKESVPEKLKHKGVKEKRILIENDYDKVMGFVLKSTGLKEKQEKVTVDVMRFFGVFLGTVMYMVYMGKKNY
jgi:threonine synthase